VPNPRQDYVDEFVMFNYNSCSLWVVLGKDLAQFKQKTSHPNISSVCGNSLSRFWKRN